MVSGGSDCFAGRNIGVLTETAGIAAYMDDSLHWGILYQVRRKKPYMSVICVVGSGKT